MTLRRRLLNFGDRSTDYRMGVGAENELPKLLAGAVGKPSRAFMLYDSALDEERCLTVRRALIDGGFEVHELAVDEGATISMTMASDALASIEGAGITTEDLLVGVGGTATCSLASFCARLWLGGIMCALVPTTLDAMIACPTAMESLAVEDSADSSVLGASAVSIKPEVALVVSDLDWVRELPVEQNGMGYVRMVAAALTDSRKSWEGFETLPEGLRAGGEVAFLEGIGLALSARLNTVKSVSPSARKALMYGEMTARALRTCLGEGYPAYRLLAEGMRFEARLAVDVHDFSVDVMFEQDDYLEDLGIEELSFDLEPEVFIKALKDERFRSANRFQLALPKHPGTLRLTSVEDEVLERHARAFLGSRAS